MKKKQQGVSVIEAMIVIVTLTILMLIVLPKLFDNTQYQRLQKARNDITTIAHALNLYKQDNKFYPNNDQGLQALVKKPTNKPLPKHWHQYIRELPRDPWGKAYQYLIPGEHNKAYDLYSYGPTGIANKNTEVGNWDKRSD